MNKSELLSSPPAGVPVPAGQSGNEAFTLFDCRSFQVTNALIGEGSNQNVSVGRAIGGPLWLDDLDEAAFNGASFEIDYLLIWLAKSSLSMSMTTSGAFNTAGTTLAFDAIEAAVGSLNFTLGLQTRMFHYDMDDPNTRSLAAREASADVQAR